MIVKFELDTKDNTDLIVIQHLFNTLKVDIKDVQPPTETPPAEDPPKKKRGRPKTKKGADEKKESEIKEMDFKELDSYLVHKEKDPTSFEVRWMAKLFKKEHGEVQSVREILNDLGAQNFTDLPEDKFKEFTLKLAEKYAALATDADEDNEEDLEI